MAHQPTGTEILGADERRELDVLEEFLSERDDSPGEQYSEFTKLIGHQAEMMETWIEGWD